MRFEQTREILAHIRDFHKSLAVCYRGLEGDSVRERARLLLDYLVSREKELADALDAFVADADPELLDTWFQFADESKALVLACPVVEPDKEMGVEEISALCEEAHDCLIAAFDEIISNCESNRVVDVFQQLRDQADKDWHRVVHDINRLSDI